LKSRLFQLLPPLLPVFYWVVLDRLSGTPFVWARPVRHGLLTGGIFCLAALFSRWADQGENQKAGTLYGAFLMALVIGSGLAALKSEAVFPAWGFLVVFFAFILWADRFFFDRFSRAAGIGARAALLAIGGAVPAGLKQITVSFGEEEFFAALEGLALAGYGLVLVAAYGLSGRQRRPSAPTRAGRPAFPLFALLIMTVSAWGYGAIRGYQQSFFSPSPPVYPGISPERPFVCGRLSVDPAPAAAQAFRQKLIGAVKAKPDKNTPEWGWLALTEGDPAWRQAFRTGLLEEADRARFTGPAHSVKFVQYEAALRIYFYHQVSQAYPRLFSPAEKERLQSWFRAINRRAQTVEWVDVFYGIAFSALPAGPYANQEIGSGLLSLLEFSRLADPGLTAANREYLRKTPRGWAARFRNTDDAYAYQAEWLYNAYLQQLNDGTTPHQNRRLSFEWLLLQALPDGAGPDYNLPGKSPLAESAYLGAQLLREPRYLWLAAKALERTLADGGSVAVAPGLEKPLDLTGISPEEGSCLLYGDSGLPNQTGPLAPDKIVFRDGWTDDSLYLLLNLRFSGWHRYKATNTVTLIQQQGILTRDRLEWKSYGWLPAGRRVLRDKRIPRENLNGLVIERSGLSRVLNQVTGLGGPWAQDPPHYAAVEDFATGPPGDRSTTVIRNWHGWEHWRTIHFYRGGPVVVADRVSGPPGRKGAVCWHLPPEVIVRKSDWSAGEERGGKTSVLLTVVQTDPVRPPGTGLPGGGDLRDLRLETEQGQLNLVTVFLTRGWSRAAVRPVREQGRLQVEVRDQGRSVTIPVSDKRP